MAARFIEAVEDVLAGCRDVSFVYDLLLRFIGWCPMRAITSVDLDLLKAWGLLLDEVERTAPTLIFACGRPYC